MQSNEISFQDLGLSESLLKSLQKLGYETPSPIQSQSIPILLEGHDLIGQAQTGTGKTAAFALPLLDRIANKKQQLQMLILTPTRELAIQVAEALQSYAHFIDGMHVLPIYGGQAISLQLKQLRRRPQIIVGTPGRVMDHIRRNAIDLSELSAMVLDEADEMLNMGFIDDIKWILDKTPDSRQTALFSATMPKEIRRVAHQYLNSPKEVSIKSKTATTDTIDQYYWRISGINKLDALTRILEVEDTDGLIIFVRTKNSTVELADKLEARGYACSALNGDMTQSLRERTVDKLKQGKLDIVIATDVAARGLDVQRISHVINYDVPYDTESYVHRIGRTGRAGRSGKAILFIAPREIRMLRSIERATKSAIPELSLPSRELITAKRIERLTGLISECLGTDLAFFAKTSEELCAQLEIEPNQLATALLCMVQKDRPLQLPEQKPVKTYERREGRDGRDNRFSEPRERRSRQRSRKDIPMNTFRIAVGREHGINPGSIVGAIANEGKIDSQLIGHIRLHERYSTVDLAESVSVKTLKLLRNVRLCGHPMQLETLKNKRS